MLEQKIEALTRAVEALTQAISASAPMPIAPVKIEVVKATAPVQMVADEQDTPSPAFDAQTLKDMTLVKSRAGHQADIRAKLNDMGVKKLQDLAQDQAAEFYQWVIALGDN
jgi:uncharacterized metal-binding protein